MREAIFPDIRAVAGLHPRLPRLSCGDAGRVTATVLSPQVHRGDEQMMNHRLASALNLMGGSEWRHICNKITGILPDGR